MFSSDSRILAGHIGDGRVRLWDATTGIMYRTFGNESTTLFYRPSALSLSSDGKQLTYASTSDKVELRSWSIETTQLSNEVAIDVSGTCALAISSDDQSLAIGYREFKDKISIRLWNAKTGLSANVFKYRSVQPVELAFSPNGKRLVTQLSDDGMFLLDLDTNALELIGTTSLYGAAFSPDSAYLAVSCVEGVQVWNCRTSYLHRDLRVQVYGARAQALAFSPDGETLATGSALSTIRFIELNTTEADMSENIQADGAISITVSSDDRLMAMSSKENLIEIYDLTSRSIYRKLEGSFDRAYRLRFSQDCTKLVTAHKPTDFYSGKLLLWNLTLEPSSIDLCPWDLLTQDLQRENIFHSPFFSHDGNYIATQSHSRGEFCVWNLKEKTQEKVSIEPEIGGNVFILGGKFSPDGKRIVFLLDTHGLHGIRCIDVKGGRMSDLVIDGNPWGFALSPDNRLIAVSFSRSIKIWDCNTNEFCCSIALGGSSRLEFSSTGEMLKTAYGWIKLQDSSSDQTELSLSLPGWSVRDGWIEWKGQRVLRLPSDFRKPLTCTGNTFIWGYQGRPVFLDLDSNGPTLTEKQGRLTYL